jgi:uncharacterized protein (DUF2141 family)
MLLILLGLLAADPPQEKTSSIVVSFNNLRNTSGQVTCVLFDSPKGFPGTSPLPNGEQHVKPSGSCTFEALPPGDYAVLVYHDENANNLFDRDAVGVPTEGYGVSNNALPKLSAPTFTGAHFHLDSSELKALSVSLRYVTPSLRRQARPQP